MLTPKASPGGIPVSKQLYSFFPHGLQHVKTQEAQAGACPTSAASGSRACILGYYLGKVRQVRKSETWVKERALVMFQYKGACWTTFIFI